MNEMFSWVAVINDILYCNKMRILFYCALASVITCFAHETSPNTNNTVLLARSWLNSPYVFDPLEDNAKSIRTDAFDCFSLIQTLISAHNSIDQTQMIEHLDAIRYQKSPKNYTHRYHFASHEWLPAMIKKGYLTDSTSQLGLKSEHIQQWAHPKAFWVYQSSLHPEFKHDIEQLSPPQKVCQSMAYISINELQQHPLPKQSNPMIVAIVNHDWPQQSAINTQLLVSHFGLVFYDNNQWFIIHASSKQHRVIQETFDDFIAQRAHHPHIIGLAFYSLT